LNKTNALLNRADALYDEGQEQFNYSDFRGAIEKWEEALSIFLKLGEKKARGEALNNMGNAYKNLGDYPKAISSYEKALAIAGETEDQPGKGNSLNSLAWLYATSKSTEFRNGKLALQYAEKALELDKYNPEYVDTFAAALAQAGRFAEAVAKQEEAIVLFKTIGAEDLSKFKKRLDLYKEKSAFTE
jgi:tetratricopeptide (TPR) repeat protein